MKTCVRRNLKTGVRELVVGGKVLSSISRLRWSIRSERAKFEAQVQATAAMVKIVREKEKSA